MTWPISGPASGNRPIRRPRHCHLLYPGVHAVPACVEKPVVKMTSVPSSTRPSAQNEAELAASLDLNAAFVNHVEESLTQLA